MNEKIQLIIKLCLESKLKNPIELFEIIVKNPSINMHGPEHHFLDGACLLTAYFNTVNRIDLKDALEKLSVEAIKMPGAICGKWGVCGAVTSLGAALAIIENTGPLTTNPTWGDHMMYTSKALETLGKVNGPRCCKRDGVLSLIEAIGYVEEYLHVKLDSSTFVCDFSCRNAQCIKVRCPFFRK